MLRCVRFYRLLGLGVAMLPACVLCVCTIVFIFFVCMCVMCTCMYLCGGVFHVYAFVCCAYVVFISMLVCVCARVCVCVCAY